MTLPRFGHFCDHFLYPASVSKSPALGPCVWVVNLLWLPSMEATDVEEHLLKTEASTRRPGCHWC